MEMQLFAVLSLLCWVAILINLALTLRIIRWIRATDEARKLYEVPVESQPLDIGAPAPDFKARTLAGQAIRLDDYAGRMVAFIFVSPVCGHCRMEMPMLIKLAPLAKKNANVEIILVSDWGPVVTQQWLDEMRSEDGVNVTLPILIAPRGKSDFLDDYNTRHMTPGFCLLDGHSNVQATGRIPSPEWNKLKRNWERVTKLSPLMFNLHQ